MKVLKILLIMAGGVVVFAVGIFAFVFLSTGGAVDSADGLFARIAAGEVRAAYDETAPALRRAHSFEEFEAVVGTLGLDQFASASWNSREISGDSAVLNGTVTLADGSAVPLEVTLVETDAGWQVVAFTGQAGAAAAGGS